METRVRGRFGRSEVSAKKLRVVGGGDDGGGGGGDGGDGDGSGG